MSTKIGRFWIKTFFLLALLVTLSFWHTMLNGSIHLIRVVAEINNTFQNGFLLGSSDPQYAHPMERLPKSDYTTLMNITTFRFVILNNCSSALLLLVLVHSAPANYERRKSIRKTWGTKRDNVTVLFMLGNVTNAKILERIHKENREYDDIIQGSFLDGYRNMTYKHVMTLKYAIYHCPQAKYVLKTDDDVFVNMPTLLDYLILDLSPHGAKKLLSCSQQEKAPVERSYRSKWRVSFGDYKQRYYPPYCPGWIIIYSPDVVFALYEEVQKTKYFWIDDVLVTGFVREKLNITIKDIAALVLPEDLTRKIVARKMVNASVPTFLFGPANFAAKNMYKMYEATKNASGKFTR